MPITKPRGSHKATRFTESVIREITRLSDQHGAVNLSKGFPDFAAPAAIKQAACDAVLGDVNQYAMTWGAKPLRDAIAHDMTTRHGRRGAHVARGDEGPRHAGAGEEDAAEEEARTKARARG